MPGTILPAVRLPTVIPPTDGDGIAQDTVVVELPPSNKFSIAWPSEPPPNMPPLHVSERPMLSSSDAESEVSDSESSDVDRAGVRGAGGGSGKRFRPEDSEDSDFTPTNRLHTEQNPMDNAIPQIPRLSRAFSVPLPSQLGYLQNPRRGPVDPKVPDTPAPIIRLAPELSHLHELSLELADSVQMVIQTLLQLSPPQVLDPAKEQFSACTLPIPTPSISAMLTAMKNLNYMSANMATLGAIYPPLPSVTDVLEPPPPSPPPPPQSPVIIVRDFDIGETLQSMGDALGGVAAEAGVDLVLFHGDVGMKHVAVHGDESGISYTLSHIVRHIIATAHRGDAVEIGLFLVAPAMVVPEETDSPPEIPLDATDPAGVLSASPDPNAPLRCTFQMTHVFSASTDPSSESSQIPPSARQEPSLKSHIFRRLLQHIEATFDETATSTTRCFKLSLTLDRGSPAVVNPAVILADNDPILHLFPDLRISGEPTLEDLAQFVDTLKGKVVQLYASSDGLFARHLTSYLTSWGLNVSPVTLDSDGEGSPETSDKPPPQAEHPPPTNQGYSGGAVLQTLPEQDTAPISPSPPSNPSSQNPSFIIIDDDLEALRGRLRKIRSEQQYPLHISSRKRPSLAAHHRPRSSPQVARAMSMSGIAPSGSSPRTPPAVIIHFTSLSNFKLVKSILQSILAPAGNTTTRLPEVIVIPKPAGPRRVLTALHTALTKPIVDPFFSPIATSPISPGLQPPASYFSGAGSPQSPLTRPSGSPRTNSHNSNPSTRSPKDYPIEGTNLAPPSPLGLSEGMDYFSEAAVKLGTSPSSGLVIQSPDGQPAGIFFHPRLRGSRSSLSAGNLERDKGQFFGIHGRDKTPHRRFHDLDDGKAKGTASSAGSTLRRNSKSSSAVEVTSTGNSEELATNGTKKPKTFLRSTTQTPIPSQSLTLSSPDPATSLEAPIIPGTRSPTAVRKVSPLDSLRKSSTPPTSPRVTTAPSGTMPRRGSTMRSPVDITEPTATPTATVAAAMVAPPKKIKLPDATSIVPPINVLVVEDNPINQTILTTFMRRKKIKYDVAKNGEEAVKKWKSGKFHLILMDIQMPVMDGIAATKEIRRLEKVNASQGFPTTPLSDGPRTPETPLTNSTSASPYRSSVIIVALTASSLQSDRVAALAAGCNDFLTKPVSLDWLNSKIIEWGSIKALQMWADLKPETAKSFSKGRDVQAQNVARRLHVPEGRATPTDSPSRSSSLPRSPASGSAAAGPSSVAALVKSGPAFLPPFAESPKPALPPGDSLPPEPSTAGLSNSEGMQFRLHPELDLLTDLFEKARSPIPFRAGDPGDYSSRPSFTRISNVTMATALEAKASSHPSTGGLGA
ncbi:hypothetical protein OF83DRAFT_1065805 [Amylostereum chailletii]|nr:hypothetical protein OF83DRAFT_1065805 [Amylostereum chailletii]